MISWLAGVWHRLNEAIRPGRADFDLQEELRDHLEREVSRQLDEGVTPVEARRRALVRIGGLDATRDAVRDERAGHLVEESIADVRLAARAARRSPAFTAAVVLSLAMGVGGATAVFGVVNAVLVRPLPYGDADRLFMIRIWWKDFSSSLSPADFAALEEQSGEVATFGAYFRPDDGFALATPAGPELVDGAIMTAGLPRVLGVTPIVGRGFSDTPNAPEALISETLWRERYGASDAAIGQSIVLDGDVYAIVGVMPAGFNVPGERKGAAWLKALSRQPTRRGPFYLNTIGRLNPGLSPETGGARLTESVTPLLRERYGVEPNWQYRFRALKDTLVGDVRKTLLLLLGAMTLVLLISIVNVTNLLLARGTVRARELAVRASLGAGRGRLARHLLAESALLGSLGGALGVLLAYLFLTLAGNAAVRMVPRMEEVRLDAQMVLFAIACGVGSGLVAGVLPALRLPWRRLGAFLRGRGRTSGVGPVHGRARQTLVIAEVALTVTVLTAAMLLAKSMLRLHDVDPGFRPGGLASFRLSLPDDPYDNDDRLSAFLTTLQERLTADLGASAVAFALALPPDLLVVSNNYTVEGLSGGSAGASGLAEWNVVTGSYFSTMGIRAVAGRTFGSGDTAASPPVAIVNETFVRRHYAEGGAIGRRFKGGDWDPAEPWTTIVGVVADVPYGKGLWGGADATIYRPYSQSLWVQSPYVIIKTDRDAPRLAPVVQQTVKALDPNLPVRDFAMMEERIRLSTLEPRVRSLLFAMIAGLAVALSVTGIYGVMAYHVDQRRRETAIRRALGARSGDILGATVLAGLRLAFAGILIGTGGAILMTRSLSSMLFQVSPRDPGTLMTVAVLLATVALLACSVPALRSARIDPASVLRDE